MVGIYKELATRLEERRPKCPFCGGEVQYNGDYFHPRWVCGGCHMEMMVVGLCEDALLDALNDDA